MHWCVGALAMFAQLLLLIAPFGEVRERGTVTRTLAAAESASGISTIAADHGASRPHDATTCPACIAQSLHAQLVPAMALATYTVADRAPSDRRSSLLPHHDPPAAHQSRAPPTVS